MNAILWRVASQVVRSRIPPPPVPITFKRIILPPPRKAKPKPHKKIVHKIAPPKPKPKPRTRPKPQVYPKPTARTPPRPPQHLPPRAHNRVLTAKGPTTAQHAALPGGHAPLGAPLMNQRPGEDTGNQPSAPQQPPAPQPRPLPVTTPPQPVTEPLPTPPPPVPKPILEPVGPTKNAQPSSQVYPDIPEDLTSEDYKSSVRVKVDVAADGSFTVSLVTSSGKMEVDQRVLDALKRWKWKPALQNGKPIASTLRFRFNFEVQ
jgi:protein TonB